MLTIIRLFRYYRRGGCSLTHALSRAVSVYRRYP